MSSHWNVPLKTCLQEYGSSNSEWAFSFILAHTHMTKINTSTKIHTKTCNIFNPFKIRNKSKLIPPWPQPVSPCPHKTPACQAYQVTKRVMEPSRPQWKLLIHLHSMANVSCSLPQDMTCGLQLVYEARMVKERQSEQREQATGRTAFRVPGTSVCHGQEISNSKHWGLARSERTWTEEDTRKKGEQRNAGIKWKEMLIAKHAHLGNLATAHTYFMGRRLVYTWNVWHGQHRLTLPPPFTYEQTVSNWYL